MSAARTSEAIKRILELVKDGRLSTSEAVKLLGTLSRNLARVPEEVWERQFALLRDGMSADDLAQLLAAQSDFPPAPPAPPRAPFASRGTARVMRLEIESADGSTVKVNLPVGLANFALKLIPRDAQSALTARGMDLEALSEMLQGDVPDGEIVSIDGSDGSTISLRVE